MTMGASNSCLEVATEICAERGLAVLSLDAAVDDEFKPAEVRASCGEPGKEQA